MLQVTAVDGQFGTHRLRRGNAPELPDETWFGIIIKQAIRHGTFGSLTQLIQTIERYNELEHRL
jgi:hypothetical protein